MTTVEDLSIIVANMHDAGWHHRRRGFMLCNVRPGDASNHLLEEAVELQAELLQGNSSEARDEAADLLGVFLHLLHVSNLPLKAVAERCREKLNENFTSLEAEIETKTPGMTRNHRSRT